MKEYFSTLLVISAAVSFLGAFARGLKLEKTVRFSLGVLVLAAAVLPLTGIIKELPKLEFIPESGESGETGDYEIVSERAFCEGIRKYLADELSLPIENVEVFVSDFDFRNMRAELITVLLKGRGIFADPVFVEGLIENAGLGNCRCEIEL